MTKSFPYLGDEGRRGAQNGGENGKGLHGGCIVLLLQQCKRNAARTRVLTGSCWYYENVGSTDDVGRVMRRPTTKDFL
jgi:hypothetical protein